MTVVPGYEYVVTTTSSCTVTDDATGTELVTAYAGQQAVFQAIGASITLSDPEAIVKVRRSPFESTPGGALSLAGGSVLPAGYIQAHFLESEGSANITTPYQSGPDTGLYCRSEAIYGNRGAMGYAYQMRVPKPSLVGYAPQSIDASWVGADIRLLKSLPKSVIVDGWLNWKNSKIAQAASEFGEQSAELAGEPPAGQITIFKAGSSWYGRIYRAGVSEGNKVSSMYIPAVDDAGKPCLYDTILKKPLYNTTSTPFVVGLTLAQLAILTTRLPDTGGTLTLSLPAEANTPEVADMLQQCHDTKGWTLTVYEYRPAAAATYSLRRVRAVVWCRKVSAEYGGYVDSTGTRWQVERCAAVFGPLGNDPTAYGYEPFDSVEQAAEEWDLQPYVYPEDTEPTID